MTGRYKAYAEYKDSDVDWLEAIPVHWDSKALKLLCSYNDEVIAENTDPATIIEYVDIGSVSAVDGISKTEKMTFGKSPSRARRIVRDGDVIISTVRTYLEAIAPISSPPKNLIVSTGFAVIRPNTQLHKGFAAYCLRAKGFIREVVARSVGISYPAINASELVNIKVPCLPYVEQQQIANFLDHETAKIDTLITKQEKLIELLKEKRQAVISHAVTKGLNSDAPMKDSGVEWLGEVPHCWEVGSLQYFLNAIGDVDHYMPASVDSGIPYVMTGDLNEKVSKIDFDNCKQVEESDFIKLSKRIKTSLGDIIMARYATIGSVSYVDISKDFLVSYSCVTIKPNPNEFLGLYLFYFFKSHAFLQGIQSHINTNTQGNVGVGDLKVVKVAKPSLDEQKAIVDYLESHLNKIDDLTAKAAQAINLMKERKTALISAAVTGKIDVRNWEAN